MFRNLDVLRGGSIFPSFRNQQQKINYVEAKRLFRRKIQRAFLHFDKAECIESKWTVDDVKRMLRVIKVSIKDDSVIKKIFNYVDWNDSGTIDFSKFVRFVQTPFKPSDLIRLDMALNLCNPVTFKKYHTWTVRLRPLTFSLMPGLNDIAAHFHESSNPEMYTVLDKGSRLAFINTVRVDQTSFWEIKRTLQTIPCPFMLTFQNIWLPDVDEVKDNTGIRRLSRNSERVNSIKFDNDKYPDISQSKIVENSECYINQYHNHCFHCPSENAWYLNIHLIMEDENFSAFSAFVMYLIIFSIGLSTVVYALQTVPSLEWRGWQVLEAIVSIIFFIDFAIRILVCRNVWRYMKDWLNIIDFCSVVPLWLELATAGLFNPAGLRLLRMVRLVRIVRLLKSAALNELVTVLIGTIYTCARWQIMLMWFILLSIILIGSLQFNIEQGTPRVVGDCHMMTNPIACNEDGIKEILYNQKSISECSGSCAELVKAGCCSFDQWTGSCEFQRDYSAGQYSAQTNFSQWMGLCNLEEHRVRTGESSPSPFEAVPHSMWWVAATVHMVGYGEIFPTTISGLLVASFSSLLGLVFMAFPVNIIGANFTVAVIRSRYREHAGKFKNPMGTVWDLLWEVNEFVGAYIFKPGDEMIFYSQNTALSSRKKTLQILKYPSGWSSLPFAWDGIVGLPRMSQFKLFVLYGIYGQSHRNMFKAKRIYMRKKVAEQQRENITQDCSTQKLEGPILENCSQSISCTVAGKIMLSDSQRSSERRVDSSDGSRAGWHDKEMTNNSQLLIHDKSLERTCNSASNSVSLIMCQDQAHSPSQRTREANGCIYLT